LSPAADEDALRVGTQAMSSVIVDYLARTSAK
jgi:hypothetical protein